MKVGIFKKILAQKISNHKGGFFSLVKSSSMLFPPSGPENDRSSFGDSELTAFSPWESCEPENYRFSTDESDVPSFSPRKSSEPENDSKIAILTNLEKRGLLKLARRAVKYYLDYETIPTLKELNSEVTKDRKIKITNGMKGTMGVFVTLKKKDGHLRGCIGKSEPKRALYQEVIELAVSSAINDSRFRPVTLEELEGLDFGISILGPARRIVSPDEIHLGIHGIILEKNKKKALYLPWVAKEEGWTVNQTLTHLSAKAGLYKDAWKSGAEFLVFEAIVLSETNLLSLPVNESDNEFLIEIGYHNYASALLMWSDLNDKVRDARAERAEIKFAEYCQENSGKVATFISHIIKHYKANLMNKLAKKGTGDSHQMNNLVWRILRRLSTIKSETDEIFKPIISEIENLFESDPRYAQYIFDILVDNKCAGKKIREIFKTKWPTLSKAYPNFSSQLVKKDIDTRVKTYKNLWA